MSTESLSNFLTDNEPFLRFGAFIAVFVSLAACEVVAPRRHQTVARKLRWPGNIGILAIDVLILRLALPVSAVAMASMATANGWGLLNAWNAPIWLAVPVTIVALDFAIYLQHVLFHTLPPLWRLHRVHHADPEFDVTTGTRFHPVEICISMIYKLAVIAALGAPALAVFLFELLLNATSMFNHANIRLPLRADRLLRWFVVTPDMHRVHHSPVTREMNSNFGFNLPWWDHLCGTYKDQPAHGHENMTVGLARFRLASDQRIDRLLQQPFFRIDQGSRISGQHHPRDAK